VQPCGGTGERRALGGAHARTDGDAASPAPVSQETASRNGPAAALPASGPVRRARAALIVARGGGGSRAIRDGSESGGGDRGTEEETEGGEAEPRRSGAGASAVRCVSARLRGSKREHTPGRSSRASDQGMDLGMFVRMALALVLGAAIVAAGLVALIDWAWRALRKR
jgi:hypothetical protein